MTNQTWSPQQATALDKVAEWMKTSSKPYFYLAGYAGTGKTTLARHFAEGVEGRVVYGSFTGKAASVMRSKGCEGATTIHRLIYNPSSKGASKLRDLRAKLEEMEDRECAAAMTLRIKIQAEVKILKQPGWDLNEAASIRDASLVIIDECSMVTGKMADDLLSFGVPVLVLGDPAQLPPVGGGGFFTNGTPDFMLTEVHRQARESGILRLATEIREGKPLDYCDYGDACVIAKADLDVTTVPDFDQVIVGRNKTRHATNKRVRELMGHTRELPVAGDRLLCLKNNHDLGLLNGEIYYAAGDARDMIETVALQIEPEGGGRMQWIDAWKAPLLGLEMEHYDSSNETQEFGFGYVLTAHKAQGSQYGKVLVIDESHIFKADAARWLYTSATRAADKLVIVR